MAGEFIEFFNELIFGSGSLIGLLIILGIMLIIVSRIKYSSILFIPFSAILMVYYFDNIAGSSIFMWNIVILFFAMILMLTLEVKRK